LRNEQLSYEDVLRIVELVKSTQFSEFRLKVGEIEVHLRRKDGAAAAPAPLQAPQPAQPAPAAPAKERSETPAPDGATLLRAPMVGTFYRAPGPGAAPFVEIGQRVEPDTTVCIIEVMKLMNSIAAGVRGTVTAILVENAAAVEYGEPLIAIRPDAGVA